MNYLKKMTLWTIKGRIGMFTGNQIRTIKDEALIYDELKVVRVGSNGEGTIFNILSLANREEKSIYTGKADSVAKYLNGYFDLKVWDKPRGD